MKILLDTCVFTEIASPTGSPEVRAFIEKCDRESVYVSVLTIGEIFRGIALLPDGKRKKNLATWMQTLQQEYVHRLLPVTMDVSMIWGELTARAKKRGFQLQTVDALLAATALAHGLHVATRNTKDFKESGVSLINPWR